LADNRISLAAARKSCGLKERIAWQLERIEIAASPMAKSAHGVHSPNHGHVHHASD